MLSAKMEDYIKAIYRLQREEDGPVTTSGLAEALDVTPPTASSMLDGLEERGLVEREKYKGARLTRDGETVALEVIRHHRLLETYLTEHLGYDWAEVHDEADRLEHHISEEFERRVAAALDDPDVDPHGDPIPGAGLEPLEDGDGSTLAEYGTGEAVVVERVGDRDPEELTYLSERGIVPDQRLVVRDVTPIDTMTVRVGDDDVSLPERVAETIHVSPADETDG